MNVSLSKEAREALAKYRKEAADASDLDALLSELVVAGYKRVKGWRAQAAKRLRERRAAKRAA